jgi:hypothetical protein
MISEGEGMAWKDRKGLWIGLAAAVVVIAVACVLVFVVFQDQIFGGTSEPEQTIEDMFTAMENKDLDSFFALMDPQGLEQLESRGLMTEADLKTLLGEQLTGYESIKFENVEMETEISQDGQNAVVTVVRGTLTMVAEGETTVENAEDTGEPQEYYLVNRDGKWYMDIMSMAD